MEPVRRLVLRARQRQREGLVFQLGQLVSQEVESKGYPSLFVLHPSEAALTRMHGIVTRSPSKEAGSLHCRDHHLHHLRQVTEVKRFVGYCNFAPIMLFLGVSKSVPSDSVHRRNLLNRRHSRE